MIKPLGTRVVARKCKAKEHMTQAGIIVTGQTEREDPIPTCSVEAIGPDVANVRVGDQVLMVFAGHNFVWDGEDMLIIAKEEDIVGIR